MKHTQILSALFLCFVFAGCASREEKIDGSIFIVTQGGENIKLGLVTVSIFDRQQIDPYLTKTTADLEKTLKELKEQQASLYEKQGEAFATVTRLLKNWAAEQPQIYFNNLPTPLAVAKTDADGKFSLQLSKKGEFILAAQAQRQVIDNTEKYFWLIRVHSDGKQEMQAMLSNDNLIGANSSETAVRFPIPYHHRTNDDYNQFQ